MKNKLAIALACAALLGGPAFAGTLTEKDLAAVKADTLLMQKALANGDADTIMKLTHESAFKLAGDRAALEKVLRDSLKQFQALGLKYLETEVGTPTQTYSAGDEEVCFVPRVTVLEIDGKKVRSRTYLIAIHRVGSSEWHYLDGAGLKDRPELLHVLLPKLPADVPLPPNEIEPL